MANTLATPPPKGFTGYTGPTGYTGSMGYTGLPNQVYWTYTKPIGSQTNSVLGPDSGPIDSFYSTGDVGIPNNLLMNGSITYPDRSVQISNEGLPLDYTQFGQNFLPLSNSPTGLWSAIAISASGQYMTATISGSGPYISSNYGQGWIGPITNFTNYNSAWTCISISASGQYQTISAAPINDIIYQSTNYGNTWTQILTGIANAESLATSASGQYLIGCYSELGIGQQYLTISNTYGQTAIVLNNISTNYTSIACSASGQYMTVVTDLHGIWTSTNFGVTWTQPFGSNSFNWTSIAMSSSGQYQTATNNDFIYNSTNYGQTWNATIYELNWNFNSATVSSSGQYQAVIGNSLILVSSNFGEIANQWSVYSVPITNLTHIKMSSTGQYIAVIGSSSSHIYLSTLSVLFNSNLKVTGTITAASFSATSDYRIKNNIQDLSNHFIIDNLRPVHYDNQLTQQHDIGFIAHEVQEIFPFLVNGSKDGLTNQSLNYIGLIGVLVKEIQELKDKVTKLEKKAKNI